jgi:putative phosphotransacetylase
MKGMEILINLSNRHIHVSQEDLEILFGKNYELKSLKDLLQPGQYAAQEVLTISGPKGSIENVRILGPVRKATQCEVLQSDLFKLGLPNAPTRESGKVEGSSPFKITGPAGSVDKKEGLLVAQRHIHLDPASAEKMGLHDNQIVSLTAGSEQKKVTFHACVIRVNKSFAPECHLDFDEGNAAGIKNGDKGLITK